MATELTVAVIAGAVALASASGTIWINARNTRLTNANSRAVKQLEIDHNALQAELLRKQRTSAYSEPLARAAYDLQSRLYNLLRIDFAVTFMLGGDERERRYAIDNTTFLVAQFFGCSELVRREIQFIDLGKDVNTRALLHLQDTIAGLWGTDSHPPLLRIFAGEQRAMGEALIVPGVQRAECMGYGAFLAGFSPGTNPLIDAVRADVADLADRGDQAEARLRGVQHALIDLLGLLDPELLRFPEDRRLKA